MKDLTLKFADRADFSAFMESIGYYDDESMQDDILIDVIGNVYKETGELTEDGEPVCVKEDGYFVNVRQYPSFMSARLVLLDVILRWQRGEALYHLQQHRLLTVLQG